jgi:hypothetical protein
MTIHQMFHEQYARFASTPAEAEDRVTRIRTKDLPYVVELLDLGRPGLAYAELMRSYFEQARVLGLHLHQTERGTW